MDKCYMCEAEGITKEHAPPKSFFPKGHRHKLITVPSCDAHNHEYSEDVEYVRAAIVQQLETNGTARTFFKDKVLRAYQRNPKLVAQMFSRTTPITIDGRESGIFEIELDRFELILKAMSYAIYRNDFKKNFTGYWEIFSPQMIATKSFVQGLSDSYEDLRSALSALPFKSKSTGNPEVFKYGFCRYNAPEIFFYRFEFYEGFIVYAVGMIEPS